MPRFMIPNGKIKGTAVRIPKGQSEPVYDKPDKKENPKNADTNADVRGNEARVHNSIHVEQANDP